MEAAEQREAIICELRAIESSAASLVKSLRLLVDFTDPEKGELVPAQRKVTDSLSVWKNLFAAAAPPSPTPP